MDLEPQQQQQQQPQQGEPLDLALAKPRSQKKNSGNGKQRRDWRLRSSPRLALAVPAAGGRGVPVGSIRVKPEFKATSPPLPAMVEDWAKEEPQGTPENPHWWFLGGDCDSTEAWVPPQGVPNHLDDYLKTLPFKKRICLMMKMARPGFPS